MRKTVFYNGLVHTQAATTHQYRRLVVNSMAINGRTIEAVGSNLHRDPDFKSYSRFDLRGKSIIPGLVDAHTHFAFWTTTLDQLSLHEEPSVDACLTKIKKQAAKLGKSEWIFGTGFRPAIIDTPREPIRQLLDRITDDRPTLILSKDEHSAWANSRALELGRIFLDTPDPKGGRIGRDTNGEPDGTLFEGPAIEPVISRLPLPDRAKQHRLYRQGLKLAYERGVTGVHSVDDPDFFDFYSELAEQGKVGLRINYYAGVSMLEALERTKTTYGSGTEFFRMAGLKIFSDGSLGSATALCFKPYPDNKNNFGIETTSVATMKQLVRRAARLGMPSAIHAIGDKAVSNVLDVFESAPKLPPHVRHRIEHMQLMRRSDIKRLKRLRVIASMQPSHCPSDILASRRHWGERSANAFIFRTLIENGIDLAFGSDVPIEPLNPIDGIRAAVRRAQVGSRDIFYPEQRITIGEALFAFTAGPAIASGEADRRGYLLPGYPADMVILDQDLTRTPATRLNDIAILATILDGQVMYQRPSLKL